MNIRMLALQAGLSRSTLLYYESVGLLRRPPRTEGNYRAYDESDLLRLQQIRTYRKVGLTLTAIRTLLQQPKGDAAALLQRRLIDIDAEVENLRAHQRTILRLLGRSRSLRTTGAISKAKWVDVMARAGFTERDMDRWHAEFETSAPREHEAFLKFLRIQPAEIRSIREASRRAGRGPRPR